MPLRKCAGCGESKPKKELVRVVRARTAPSRWTLWAKKPGRGAYVPKGGVPGQGAQGKAH